MENSNQRKKEARFVEVVSPADGHRHGAVEPPKYVYYATRGSKWME